MNIITLKLKTKDSGYYLTKTIKNISVNQNKAEIK